MIQIRHTMNDFFKKYAGHIGFSFRKSECRKGYASLMLQSILPIAAFIGLTRVLVACESRNIASEKVILNNNGVYENSVVFDDGFLDRGIIVKQFWIKT